jgi:hypothetical protein
MQKSEPPAPAEAVEMQKGSALPQKGLHYRYHPCLEWMNGWDAED